MSSAVRINDLCVYFGQQQVLRIGAFDKARRPAARRGIQHGAILACCRHHTQGRQRHKVLAMRVEMVQLLAHGTLCRLGIQRTQLFVRGDHAASPSGRGPVAA